MNINPETQFLNWLATLSALSCDLADSIERSPASELEIKLRKLESRLKLIEDYGRQHNIDQLSYKHEIFEIKRNHELIAIRLEKKPRGFFTNSFIVSMAEKLEVVDGAFRIFGVPIFLTPVIRILRNLGSFFTNQRSLPSPKYDEMPQVEPTKEPTVFYENFSITRLLLSQDYFYKSTKGMLIDIDVKFYDLTEINCTMQMSFWFANGKPIINRYQKTQAKLEKIIKPDAKDYDKKNMRFFMSYNTLGLGIGLYKCKLRINAIKSDNAQTIGNPRDEFFELIDPGTKP